MPVTHPFFRTCRQHVGGSYADSGRAYYIRDPRYAKSPESYVRPFLLIQEDLRRIFEHIEPSDVNSECYSFRLYEIIIRSCIEIEANFKAILSENNYGSSPRQRWSMLDYKNLEPTHLLTGYRIQVPFWEGVGGVRSPFSSWAANEGLLW